MAVDVIVQHPYSFRPKGMPLLRAFAVFVLKSTVKITEAEITVNSVDVPFLGDFEPVSQNFKIVSEEEGGLFEYLLFVRYDSPLNPRFDEKKLRFLSGSASLADLTYSIVIGGDTLPDPLNGVPTPVIEIDPCDLR